jgi:hypothetical protein
MDDVQITFIVGACIFGVGAIVTGLIFSVFVWKNYRTREQLLADGKISSARNVHWLNSIAIYLILFTAFVLFTGLYATQATYSGLYPAGPTRIIQWMRWLVLAIAGAVYIAGLAFLLTEDSDSTWNRHPRPALRFQSYFIVFYYFLAYVAILLATLVATNDGKIVLMVFSIVLFLISGVLFLVPENKCAIHNPEHPHDYVLFTGNDRRGPPVPAREKQRLEALEHVDASERTAVIMAYRWVFVFFVGFAYLFNVVVWFCSISNNIWTGGLSFRNEVILYLVSDFILLVLFGLVFIGLTFWYGMKTVSIEDKLGNITYATRLSTGAPFTSLGAANAMTPMASGNGTPTALRQRKPLMLQQQQQQQQQSVQRRVKS